MYKDTHCTFCFCNSSSSRNELEAILTTTRDNKINDSKILSLVPRSLINQVNACVDLCSDTLVEKASLRRLWYK